MNSRVVKDDMALKPRDFFLVPSPTLDHEMAHLTINLSSYSEISRSNPFYLMINVIPKPHVPLENSF